MSQNTLEKFLQRQKEINKNVIIQERTYHSRYYRFANEMDEADELPDEQPAQEPAGDMGAPEQPVDAQPDNADPAADIDALPGVEDGTADSPEDPSMDDGDGNMDISMDDELPGDESVEATAEGEDTEIDVTELVNSTQEVSVKVDDVVMKLDQHNQNLTNVIQSIGAISPMLQNMQSAINNLSHQVELMRPPTEEERRKVVKQTSYPFNQDLTDYQSGVGPKTQTDMENKLDILNHDNIVSTYNEKEIKDTF